MSAHTLVTLLILAGLATGSQAAMYKWVDGNGLTVYSQTPPASGQSTLIKPPPPPAETPEEAQKRLNQQIQKLDDAAEDRELASQKKGEEENQADVFRTNCANAESNLLNLEGTPRKLMRKPDGEYVRLAEEERQKMIQEARDQIKQFCK